MAATLEQIMKQLAPTYDPQRALIAQQQAALPGQQAADVAGLDAAKTNAFSDINIQANDRGMSYSGMPIAEQSRYVGERYLPALAGIKNSYADKGFQLQNALLGINQAQSQQAQAQLQAQQKAEYEYAIEQQKLAQQRAAARQNSLDMAGLFNMNRPAPVDPVSAARGLAKTRLQEGLAGGVNQPFYREAVLKELLAMGIDGKTANQIIYREVFPDNWAGAPAKKTTAMIPWAPPSTAQSVTSNANALFRKF